MGMRTPEGYSADVVISLEIRAGDRGTVTLEIDGEPRTWPIEVTSIAERPDNPIEDSTHVAIYFRPVVPERHN